MEMPGIEPGASYMQSMRSTTELHPLYLAMRTKKKYRNSLIRVCPLTLPMDGN